MFDTLDDPNPPTPPPGSLHRVKRRARHLRRRRQAVIAAPAAAAVGTVAWLSVLQRSGEEVQVASIGASTTTAQTAFDHDDRGEVLRLSPVPDGWAYAGERLEQAPSEASFIRSVYYAPVDGREASLSVVRAEIGASQLATHRRVDGAEAVTPGGIPVVIRDAGGGYVELTHYVDENLMVSLGVPSDLQPRALALFDSVEFVEPAPRCVEADVAAGGVDGCEPLRVRVLPDGTVEPMG